MARPTAPQLRGMIVTPPLLRQVEGSLDSILAAWKAGTGQLWLDVTNPDPDLLAALERTFRLDMEALEQILDPSHKAHLREYEDYFFLQLPLPVQESADGCFASEELDIFCSPNFILTIHSQPQGALTNLWERHSGATARRMMGRWPDTLLYHIGDAVLTAFYPHLERLEDEHDRLEPQIFAARESQTQAVLGLKRDLHDIRRAAAPLRDALGALARRDFLLLDKRHRYLFEELFARSVRVLEYAANLHSLCDGLLHADLALHNNRMNEVMKTLTIVATIMMPLTVLTGFFGMNFEHIPGLDSPPAFWGVTGFMALLALGLVAYFRRRGWW